MKVGNVQTLILGIESSCDETAAAVIADGGRILSSIVASQLDVHARYGGVVPELASREHLRAITPVVREALDKADIRLEDLSAIAVTSGPGLVGSLLVGVTYAKALCFAKNLPLIAVNHVEGHIHSVLLQNENISFPALALVVSGGHTHLFEVVEPGVYKLLGKTRDDAAGEAFDKAGKLLGFPYPGGPVIDKVAAHGDPRGVKFTFVKMSGNPLDFSFSGIKTAVLRWTETHNVKAEIEARRALVNPTLEELLAHTPQGTRAAEQINTETIIIAGGVACNSGLQAAAAKRNGYRFLFPSFSLATDNAAMIAAAALPKLKRRDFAGLDLRVKASLALAV